MKSTAPHLHLLSLIDRFDGSASELAATLGVDRTTIWRLKSGKIAKVNRYITALEKRVTAGEANPLDRVIEDLATWSRHSADVRTLLTLLHTVLHNSATS